MIPRPKVGETEEDLLNQEKEFLKQSGKLPTQKRKEVVSEQNEAQQSIFPCVIGEIVEKHTNVSGLYSAIKHEQLKRGFPATFNINSNITHNKKVKKSLFALHMERNKNKNKEFTKAEYDDLEISMRSETCDVGEIQTKTTVQQNRNTNENESIHKENLDKLSRMSEKEILEAQRKLYETLDPKVIEFLKNKEKSKAKPELEETTTLEDVEMETSDAGGEVDIQKLTSYVGEKWINMDFVEKEKLEWIGDIPDSKALEPDQPYSARFDFRGELQPFTSETVDVTKSLHHHGDEPERPGYTIQELYQLSRSTVLQQRILALNTIANIIRKTKLGYYDICFNGYLLHKLLEADLFLLLRFSIDENALFPAAINCLRRLLYNDTDEYCLDKLLNVIDDVQPLLYDEMQTNKEEEKELKDNTVINCDLVKGVVRTDLLVRISYILNNFKCDREAVTNAVLCFIRIARHSVESSNQILSTPNLLDIVYSTANCEKPIYQSLKLFRVLVGQSMELASTITDKYPMSFLISILNSESMTEISRSEFYLLKLEAAHFWRNCLRHDLMTDEFRSWTPCLVRLLRFFVEKVDLCGEGDFDFELFSSLSSLLTVSIRKKLEIDSNCLAALYVCLEKWLKQLIHFDGYNYAGLKALGACFDFFVNYFKFHSVDQTGLSFILKLNSVILTLIDSHVFETMASNLTNFSHILVVDVVNRDPPNLPSLCSVYEEGRDFLRIVNNQSPVAFFIPFVKYLMCSYSVRHDCINSIESFIRCPGIQKYLTMVNKSKKNIQNWFTRYEITLLSDIGRLLSLIDDEKTQTLCFRLLPMIRVDDNNAETSLSLIFGKTVWKSDLLSVYSRNICKTLPDSDSVCRYNSDLFGEDWLFKVISLLRGKEAVADVAKVLAFISTILESRSELLDRLPHGIRFYHLCAVFLTDSNVFDDEIQKHLKAIFPFVLRVRNEIKLDKKMKDKKSFYDLYMELITQYAGVSYGLHIFAEFVLFPLQNRFDVSYRKLLWFEYLHVLRVVTLPYPTVDFIDVSDFVEPCETDESLLVAYLNSVLNNVIIKTRNPFVYQIAVQNVKNYLRSPGSDSKLTNFLRLKIESTKNERTKSDFLS